MTIENRPTLVFEDINRLRIHHRAVDAFTLAQQLKFQAEIGRSCLNALGLLSYDFPFAIREKGTDDLLVFAGWEVLLQQHSAKLHEDSLVPVLVFNTKRFNIANQAWRYLLGQISRSLHEDTFLIHTMRFAEFCPCISKITDQPSTSQLKPHLFAENWLRVGSKRAKRQMARWMAKRSY